MGQLVNPIGFRVGYSPAWLWRDFWCVKSLYYSEYLYNIFYFRENLDSDIHFFLQKNFGFCYSHFCIYKRLNRFYIGIYFYGGALEHGIQTSVKFMLWGHWRKRHKNKSRFQLVTKHARILLGQMFQFEKLGTVAWLFQSHYKPPHRIKRYRLAWDKRDVSFTNYHLYKKWLKLESGISTRKLVKYYKQLFLWYSSLPFIVRYRFNDFWYMTELDRFMKTYKADTWILRWRNIKNYRWKTKKGVGRLGRQRQWRWTMDKNRRKQADQRLHVLQNWNYSKWSAFDFFSNEWKGWGAINRNINLMGRKKRKRGGYSPLTGGPVRALIYYVLNGVVVKKAPGKQLKYRLTGKLQQHRAKHRVFFPTSWVERTESFQRKIKKKRSISFLKRLKKRIHRGDFIFKFICDNLIRIFANYLQNTAYIVDYMGLSQRAWGWECVLRLDWLWYTAKRLYKLTEKLTKKVRMPLTNKYGFRRFVRFYAPNVLRTFSRNNSLKLTDQKFMYKAKEILNVFAKKNYKEGWQYYLKSAYWRNNETYKGYAIKPYNCNFSNFEKFQEYKEIHQYIRLKWFLDNKRRGARYMLYRFGYVSNKLFKFRKRPYNFFKIRKKARKNLVKNLKDEWFKHPTYLQMFWPRVLNIKCSLVKNNHDVQVDRRRVRWVGRRLFFSKNEVLKDFGSMNFLGFLPLMMRKTSKPIFTDALKVSKSGHFNASHKLNKYFEPIRRMLENRAYIWREHIFCFRAFYAKIYIEILRFFLFMEVNFFSYKTYALGNITFFKWLTSFPFKIIYYYLTNKDVTATMISRYITIKLTQGFTIKSLVKPIIKELEYMQNINYKAGILGFKFKLSGRFMRRQRLSRIWILSGKTPFSTIDNYLEYGSTTVILDHGAYTAKVWIFKPFERQLQYMPAVL